MGLNIIKIGWICIEFFRGRPLIFADGYSEV